MVDDTELNRAMADDPAAADIIIRTYHHELSSALGVGEHELLTWPALLARVRESQARVQEMDTAIGKASDVRDDDPLLRPLRDMSDDQLAWRTIDAVITRDWENLFHFAIEYRERLKDRTSSFANDKTFTSGMPENADEAVDYFFRHLIGHEADNASQWGAAYTSLFPMAHKVLALRAAAATTPANARCEHCSDPVHCPSCAEELGAMVEAGIIIDETHHIDAEIYRGQLLAQKRDEKAAKALIGLGAILPEIGKEVVEVVAQRHPELRLTGGAGSGELPPEIVVSGGRAGGCGSAPDSRPPCPECSWPLHMHHSGNYACDRCGLHVQPKDVT